MSTHTCEYIYFDNNIKRKQRQSSSYIACSKLSFRETTLRRLHIIPPRVIGSLPNPDLKTSLTRKAVTTFQTLKETQQQQQQQQQDSTTQKILILIYIKKTNPKCEPFMCSLWPSV